MQSMILLDEHEAGEIEQTQEAELGGFVLQLSITHRALKTALKPNSKVFQGSPKSPWL
jgi:hypothetical protein